MEKNSKLQPWMKGSLELINHAIGHLEIGKSFDNKIAMISTDLAIESMIKNYFGLPSSITNQKKISKNKLSEIIKDFHTLIEGLKENSSKKILEKDDLKAITYFHHMRNKIYHTGDDVSIDVEDVEAYLEITKNLFSNLFNVRIDDLIKTKPSSSIGEFFMIWREIRPIMEELVVKLRIRSSIMDPRYYVMQRLISRKLIDPSYRGIYKELRDFRHEITHGYKEISEKEVKFQISRLREFLKTINKIEQSL